NDERCDARAPLRVPLQPLDELDHAARCTCREKRLDVVVQVEDAEQAEEERDCRKEREHPAVRDGLRERHAVVFEEPPACVLRRGEPVAAPELQRRPGRPAQSRSKIDQRPMRSFSSRSRPRRAKYRNVAPIPPAKTNPAEAAPAATSGSFDCSLPVMFVASPSSSRSCSTAPAS